MPLPVPRTGSPKVYLPGYKSLTPKTYNAAATQASKIMSQLASNPTAYNQFEEGQLFNVQSGRVDFNANEIIQRAIKMPAYAAEAPLRPLDAITGGAVSAVAKGVGDVVGKIPILSHAVGMLGDGLHASQVAGHAGFNTRMAQALADSIGKPDNVVVLRAPFNRPDMARGGGDMTAGQVREWAQKVWSYDMEGNPYSLRDLESRARENTLDFGNFFTAEDGMAEFFNSIVFDPLNVALFGAGTAARAVASGARAISAPQRIAAAQRYLTGVTASAKWARPMQKPLGVVGTTFRYGNGYARAVGRGIGTAMHEAHAAPKFLDVNTAARGVVNGGMRQHGYLASMLTAASWGTRMRGVATIGRKAFFPGMDTSLRGSRLVGNATRAWMRGGVIQAGAQAGGEALFGGLDNYMIENEMEDNVVGGTVGWLHDVFSKVNNQHPLSDHDGFVIAAFFTPAFGVSREVIGAPGRGFVRRRNEVYGNNVANAVREKLNQTGGNYKHIDDFLTDLGRGDKARGKAMFEWYMDFTEIRKAENQLSHLTQQILDAELDGLAARLDTTAATLRTNIQRKRLTGALQPRSTADYMFEKHAEHGAVPRGRPEMASEITVTSESFIREIQGLYNSYETLGPQLSALGMDIMRGGIITKEGMQSIIEHVRLTPDGLIDTNLAREVLDMGPSLVYEGEFWREFSVSLGRESKAGRKQKATRISEDITKDDLISALEEVADSIPSSKELFNETLAMSKATGRATKGVFSIKEPPYPIGLRLKEQRANSLGRTEQLGKNDRALKNIRDVEFTPSGKAKFGAVNEIQSPAGIKFTRTDKGSYVGENGIEVAIDKGAVRITLPVSREADLMRDLNSHIFRTGPRKGQIKTGHEQAAADANLAIEDARLGIDRDAILLATQNGGRVVVAPVAAGPRLADMGYVESARIRDTKDIPWTDPGDAPVIPEMARYDDPIYEAMEQWEQRMIEGVMRGKMSVKEAQARGADSVLIRTMESLPAGKQWYHATLDAPGVRLTGLRSRKDVQRVGLGGGSDYTVSATYSKEHAERVAEVYREAGAFFRGEMTVDDLAKNLDNFPTSGGTSGMTELTYAEPTLAGKYRSGEALGPEEAWFTYNQYLRILEQRGGPINPNLVDFKAYEHIKNADPKNIGAVELDPLPEAQGRHVANENEYRLFPGSFSLKGETGKASYSFRGGDPNKIRENAAARAFQPYRPVKRYEPHERAAIGVARGDARKASLYVPMSDYLGPASDSTKWMFPEERFRMIREQRRATKNSYKQHLESANKFDEAAFNMLPFDRKISEMELRDWVDRASLTETQKFTDLMGQMERDFPSLSLRPNGTRVIVDPAESRFTMLVETRNRMQDLFLDYGPLSPVYKLYSAILEPIHTKWLGKQAQTEIHTLMGAVGWDANATEKFMAELRQEVLDSRAVEGLASLTGSHTYGSMVALPEEKVRAIAERISPTHFNAVLDRYGSYQKMMTQASNRLTRSVERRYRSGGKVNAGAMMSDRVMQTWLHGPGLRHVSTAGRSITKHWYPILRFKLDPLFQVMNWIEPYMYALFNNGRRGLRKAGPQAERRAELASANLIPPGGLYSKATGELAPELLISDPGFFTIPKNIRDPLIQDFNIKTETLMDDYLMALRNDHPVAVMMRNRFGDNIKDWSAEVDRLMNNMIKRGPEQAVRKAWKDTLEKELGYTQAELKEFIPVVERLSEMYRGVYSDLANLYVGRFSRSNLERLSNNFFIAWPISYMIKVMKWGYGVMFEKIGPVGGSAGAYLWDEYRQRYMNQLERDPEFKAWTEENDDFLFALEMLIPITPEGVGVSLNRFTKYVGSAFSDNVIPDDVRDAAFGDYSDMTIPEALSNTLRVGPARTAGLAERVLGSWEVPGFYTEKRDANPMPTFR